jgi:cytochrome b-561
MSVETVPQPPELDNGSAGLVGMMKTMPKRIYHSIFRFSPVPRNELERSQAVADNFLFHIHTAKVRERSLKFTTTLGLGFLTFFAFLILSVSGILLMFYYVPSVEQAYGRMQDLRGAVLFGNFLRNLHRWTAHAMVVLVFLHMARVFLTGGHKRPREFNWMLGVVLALLTLFLSFTGYLLPWDQLAFWAITVGTAIARYAPVMGDEIRYVLLGGNEVGGEALIRFYVLHVAVLPLITAGLIGWHFWRIRKDGGLAAPKRKRGDGNEVHAEGPAFDRFPTEPGKTYGLMMVSRLRSNNTGADVERQVQTWPGAFVRELTLFVILLLIMSAAALLVDAPLEGPADATHPPNPAKAPWYFLGLQEMVSYSAFWGGVGIPTLLVMIGLIAPYLERRRGGEGVWFHPTRTAANWTFLAIMGTLLVLTVIGTLFRGENWGFIVPW